MKRLSYLKVSASLLAAFALSSAANAAFVTGSIDFAGNGVALNGTLGTATQVTSFGTTVVSQATGSFSPFVVAFSTPVTLTAPWSLNSGAVAPFWKAGGFTFNLTSSSIVTQNASFLNVKGTGVVFGNGFSNTNGTWAFTIPNAGTNGVFTFASQTVAAPVPDGGTTMALLGLSLLGLYGAHRKLGKL